MARFFARVLLAVCGIFLFPMEAFGLELVSNQTLLVTVAGDAAYLEVASARILDVPFYAVDVGEDEVAPRMVILDEDGQEFWSQPIALDSHQLSGEPEVTSGCEVTDGALVLPLRLPYFPAIIGGGIIRPNLAQYAEELLVQGFEWENLELLSDFDPTLSGQFLWETVHPSASGDPEWSFDVVFVGDGFQNTPDDIHLFQWSMWTILRGWTDALGLLNGLGIVAMYEPVFAFHSVLRFSDESGINDDAAGISVQNNYGTYRSGEILGVPPDGQTKLLRDVQFLAPDFDGIVFLIAKYDTAAGVTRNEWLITISSAEADHGGGITARHEFAHAFHAP